MMFLEKGIRQARGTDRWIFRQKNKERQIDIIDNTVDEQRVT